MLTNLNEEGKVCGYNFSNMFNRIIKQNQNIKKHFKTDNNQINEEYLIFFVKHIGRQ